MAVTRVEDGRPVLVVLRALGLGDFLAGMPAYRALAGAFPSHRRILAAPAALAPLVQLVGTFDGVLDTAPLAPIAGRLPSPDVAVNLHGRGPQSHRILLAGAPRRLVAFAHAAVPASAAGAPWRADEHEVQRWCRLLQADGVAADPAALDVPPPAGAPEIAHGATVLHPGAASAARRWPRERWVAVARQERARGRRVLLTGGSDEEALCERIRRDAALPRDASLAGRTDLRTLAAVVAAAARVVCGDTGLAHLATALGTPSVLLFGPTRPAEWGPPPGRPWHRVLWRGRTGDPHARRPDAGLLAIGADEVIAALATLPPNPTRRPAPAPEVAA